MKTLYYYKVNYIHTDGKQNAVTIIEHSIEKVKEVFKTYYSGSKIKSIDLEKIN